MKTIFVLLLLPLILLVNGCGSDGCQGDVSWKQLEGTWKIVDAKGSLAENEIGGTYTFEEGKAVHETKRAVVKTNYSATLEGGKLTLNPVDSDVNVEYCVQMDGEQLKMDMLVANYVYTLEKQ